ncbi:MAG: hypothetical protein LBD47_01575, partial [Treponema sp.]|nr:hypothetical protein [Treponema sp.]
GARWKRSSIKPKLELQRRRRRKLNNLPLPEPATAQQVIAYQRLEPYEGKLSRTVLRREGAEQSALTQPTITGSRPID